MKPTTKPIRFRIPAKELKHCPICRRKLIRLSVEVGLIRLKEPYLGSHFRESHRAFVKHLMDSGTVFDSHHDGMCAAIDQLRSEGQLKATILAAAILELGE